MPRIVAALAARGFTDTYEVENDPLGIGPMLDVSATGPTKAGVMATQAAVTDEVQNQLQELQTDLPQRNQITSMVVTSSPKATLMVSKKARPLVAVLVVGFILVLAIPQMVDAAQNRARTRRKKKGSQRAWTRVEPPVGAFSAGDGSRSSQLTPTVGQRHETNGKLEPEAGSRGVTSSGIDF